MLFFLAVFCAEDRLWAGGSGFNVIVVINQNSTNSIQLANAYCEQRCVPPQNVLRINHSWSGGSASCALDEFQNYLLTPLLNLIQANHLTNQIQYVLLSMDIPYEVGWSNGVNSTTSTLFYGFKPDTASPVPGYPSCSLPDNSFNSYVFSELPFADAAPVTAETNSFLAVMLTDTNLATAETTLARGVASDGTLPTPTVYLAKTDDTARNVRFYEFDDAIFETRVHGDYSMIRTNTDSTSFVNALGLETGLANYDLATNEFVPGAIGDTLTSYAGDLFSVGGQTTALAFLEAGAAGSYGTVIEPCNYPQKFPDPLDYFYQSRGFSLAESYYQSVENPYQGIMVGEPLSAPFARRGAGVWQQPAAGAVVSGQTNLQFQFTAASPNLPMDQVDLFIDGTWLQTITNIPPTPGDIISVTLNNVSNSYTIPAQSTRASIAADLVSLLNASTNETQVAATAWGDRIELQSLNSAVPGNSMTLATSSGAASFLGPSRTTFLDSIAVGYHYLLLSNNPAVGDWLQLAVVKTNGNNVTIAVTNTANGATIGQLLQTLLDYVNSNPALQASDGIYGADFDDYSPDGLAAADCNLYAQSGGWAAAGIQVTLNASSDLMVLPPGPSLLQDNLSDLEARNHIYVASGSLSLPLNWTLDTTQLQDGCHELTAVAYEGTSVRTQTRLTQSIRIQNTGLVASLDTLVGGSNTDLAATLQFSVVVNTNNVDTINLYSTGGIVGSATNQAVASFAVPGPGLGLGLHPFYAIVTDTLGHQYRTATTWIRLIGPEPPLSVAAAYPPLTLVWPATAGRQYQVLAATNLLGPYTTSALVTFSNTAGIWVDTNASGGVHFYRLKTSY